jgi:8-oxo-dGTP pyrophosphatase MutT (NUDIX family)
MSESPKRRRRRRRRRGGGQQAPNQGNGKAARGAAGKKRRLQFRREKSAGGIVTRVVDGRTLVLLIRDPYGHWGFPKGHLERGERAETAAVREVMEETGLRQVGLLASIAAIEWKFRFRNKLIQKHCEFFLMESAAGETKPQKSEGITECRWVSPEEAHAMIDYENARSVLARAQSMMSERGGTPAAQTAQETPAG